MPMKSSANPSLIRKINQSAILDMIRTQGPIARTEIARKLHTSLPTVMRIIENLSAQGLVREDGTYEINGGRPRALLVFNGESHTVVGLDLGGTRMYGTVADLNGRIIREVTIPWERKSAEDNFEQVCAILNDLLKTAEQGGCRLLGAAVGVPGITNLEEGYVQWAPSLNWRNFPLKIRLAERFPDLFTLVENDVNLAALGEYGFGVQAGAESLVCITVGTGIGAGIVIDRKIYHGQHHAAGEIGYLPPNTRHLGHKFHDFGALESQASHTAMVNRAVGLLRAANDPRGNQPLSAEDIFSAARAGEAWACQVVDSAVDSLALAIGAVATLIDPAVIVLGGGISLHSDLFINPILKRLEGVLPVLPSLWASSLGYRATAMGGVLKVLDAATEHITVPHPG
ncbi:MAG TPA: hypothetical protein DCP32_08370 [Anaerolineaceae bacterium]|nr:hypothetical protein [Anaerolineaceae bacterium]HBA90313.1 hypothetical protein [Anaerolineaceae bacterium]